MNSFLKITMALFVAAFISSSPAIAADITPATPDASSIVKEKASNLVDQAKQNVEDKAKEKVDAQADKVKDSLGINKAKDAAGQIVDVNQETVTVQTPSGVGQETITTITPETPAVPAPPVAK